MLPASAAEHLSAGGTLAARIDGFVPRASQQAMAARIEQALADGETLLAESGTGTGKTFAYLVPALLSGKKVIVSTGTKNLQDQLFNRDLPRVRDALGVPVGIALLKGRQNYACRWRVAEPPARPGRRDAALWRKLAQWIATSESGDLAEFPDIAEDSPLWESATVAAEACLGADCAHFDSCFVNRARRQALKADVVVVNHHLFFADLALREEGFGQLLPTADAVIFDEAHQLAEIGAQFFGVRLSHRQFEGLIDDTLAAEQAEQSLVAELPGCLQALRVALAGFRAALPALPQRLDFAALIAQTAAADTLDALICTHTALADALTRAGERGPQLARCAARAQTLATALTHFAGEADADYVRWCEVTAHGFALQATPLELASAFQAQRRAYAGKAWVFTSATLTVAGDFGHFQRELGLHDAATAAWPSPFDYATQMLTYLPRELPRPDAPAYTEAVMTRTLPVLMASRGRAFLLFTSHRALAFAAKWLKGRVEFPIFVQGDAPRDRLLARFRASGNGVLLGTNSFWEGVDVRGEGLSCVVIDKLPFATPDDPVLRARCAAIEARGDNAFMAYQLPKAVLMLKQGAGRLIRDADDRGVLMLCDPRLTQKAYGKLFLKSLGPLTVTHELAAVEGFFAPQGLLDARAAAEPA